ncbi:MAG: outer membrane protein assembly factor BamA [Nitrospirae bacterium]|nr:outer membrane protein assembly factor BamA [Nitrospirota bacterium]
MKSLHWLAGCAFVLLLISPAYPSPFPYSGLTITRIDIKDDLGEPWPDPGQVLPLIMVKPGDRLAVPAVREGIATLYLKGIFKDIRVEAFPDNNGVRLEYIVTSIAIVDKIVIHGNRALSTGTILDALAGIEGKEPRDEKLSALRSNLLALYQAEGFYEAVVALRITSLKEPHRVALHVDIRESRPTRIAEITFFGNAVFTDKDLLKVMKSEKGSRLRRDALLDSDMEAILNKYTAKGYPAAKTGPVDIRFRDNEAFVHIQVNEGPLVTARFTGNRKFSSNKLRKTLLIWTEHDVSDSVVDSSMDKIKALYREKGYADVSIDVKKTEQPGRLDLEFTVQEGPRVMVQEIAIRGNTAFTAKEIKKQMALREPGWFTSPPFREDLLDEDVEHLRDRYLADGYLSAAVDQKTVRSGDKNAAEVSIEIIEGPQTRTGSVSFDGNTAFTEAELQKATFLKQGAPFNERLMDEDKYRLLMLYANKAYLYARVDVEKSPHDGTVDVRYRITEDLPVSIGKIILRGNIRTKDEVIMRELLVKPGDPYDYGTILTSQQRIYHFGYFRVARFDPVHPGEKEYRIDMLFTVEERPAGAVEFGVGYGDLDRLRGFVEVSHRNLWGTARYTSLRFEQSDILKRAIFNFQQPWFLGRKLENKFSLLWSDSEKLNSDTREVYYKTRKTVASFGVEKTYKKLKPSLTYQFENVVNYSVKPEAQLTPEDSGRVLVSSLSPALIWDLRDDVFNPRRGALYGIVLKEALRELWSEADFSKLTVQGSWFLPIDTSVLALSARAGMAWPFRDTVEVPLHERFYVGGSTTVRGFRQDAIGPSVLDVNGDLIPQGGSSMVVLNLELRVNPGEGFGVVVFTDAGNVWPGQEINGKDIRSSFGMGLRYGTPVGPLRVDYGQKIHRLPGESPGELHFNIGNTF